MCVVFFSLTIPMITEMQVKHQGKSSTLPINYLSVLIPQKNNCFCVLLEQLDIYEIKLYWSKLQKGKEGNRIYISHR